MTKKVIFSLYIYIFDVSKNYVTWLWWFIEFSRFNLLIKNCMNLFSKDDSFNDVDFILDVLNNLLIIVQLNQIETNIFKKIRLN